MRELRDLRCGQCGEVKLIDVAVQRFGDGTERLGPATCDDCREGKTYTICPSCGQRVEPEQEGVVYAVELERVDTFGATDYIEGVGAFPPRLSRPAGLPRQGSARSGLRAGAQPV